MKKKGSSKPDAAKSIRKLEKLQKEIEAIEEVEKLKKKQSPTSGGGSQQQQQVKGGETSSPRNQPHQESILSFSASNQWSNLLRKEKDEWTQEFSSHQPAANGDPETNIFEIKKQYSK